MLSQAKNKRNLHLSKIIVTDYAEDDVRTVFCFLAVNWKSMGCYKEHKKTAKKALPRKFATIKGIDLSNPDIKKIVNMCKAAAENDGLEIFAIRVRIS